jgi:hypothetical protein
MILGDCVDLGLSNSIFLVPLAAKAILAPMLTVISPGSFCFISISGEISISSILLLLDVFHI